MNRYVRQIQGYNINSLVMLRKNKCFLDGVNMVESQIIYPDPPAEDVRHHRRIPENPHPEYALRKTYGFEHHELPSVNSPRTNLPIQGRRSLIDSDSYHTFTQRSNDVNRTLKGKISSMPLKAESRLCNDKNLFETLRPGELEFLNDYQRKGTKNFYNIFQQEQALRQKLPKCQICSTNIDNVIKTYVCILEGCKKSYDFVCPSCHGSGKDFHSKHSIIPIMSVLYYFQKQTNDPSNTHKKAQLRILVQEISEALSELQMEIVKLTCLKEKFEITIESIQNKSEFGRISQQLLKMVRNLEDSSDYEVQCTLRKIIQSANIDSIKSTQEDNPSLKSKFFPRINQLIDELPSPYFPLKQHCTQPLLLEPMSIFTNSFIGQQLQITTSTPISLRQLGKVKLVCDGETRLSVDKVQEANVMFKGRRMDRQIRSVIDTLVKWSSRKNRFKIFEYTFDYKLNAHPTTQHSPMLSELMRIQTSCIRVSLLNIRNNDMSRKQFNQVFTNFRELKELSLNITLNHLHSQSPIVLDRPQNLLLFVKSLGGKLIRFNLKIPVNIPENTTIQILRELLNKPYLCAATLKLQEPFTGQSQFLYCQLQNFSNKRALTVMKLKLLLERTHILKKFGNRHFEVIDILL